MRVCEHVFMCGHVDTRGHVDTWGHPLGRTCVVLITTEETVRRCKQRDGFEMCVVRSNRRNKMVINS